MQIIKRGKRYECYKWIDTCEYCDSRLVFFEHDDEYGVTGFEDTCQGARIGYICPVCGEHNLALWADEKHADDRFNSFIRMKKQDTIREKIILSKKDREELTRSRELKEKGLPLED